MKITKNYNFHSKTPAVLGVTTLLALFIIHICDEKRVQFAFQEEISIFGVFFVFNALLENAQKKVHKWSKT